MNDLEASIATWNQLFGAGPFMIRPHHQTEWFRYRGTPQEADVSYAFGYLGDVMVQFIQQHDDTPSIYREVFAPGEEGFHHVATLVHDYPAERQRFVDLGYEVACELHVDGVDAAYFDTRAVTAGSPRSIPTRPASAAAFASWHRDHELLRPGDPLVIAPAPLR